MIVQPAHGVLNSHVKIPKRVVSRHHDPTPDDWFDILQRHLELIDRIEGAISKTPVFFRLHFFPPSLKDVGLVIKLDPAYNDGYYKEQPKRGMEVYFMAAYLWYFGHDFYAHKWKTKEELLKGLRDVGLGSAKADANDTIWREEALMNFDVSAQLPNVKARTLVIGVNDDALFPPSTFKPIAAAIPGAEVFAYDSILGHLGCALHLTKAGEVITEFLK